MSDGAKNMMPKKRAVRCAVKYPVVFITGGLIYAGLELRCRARTHWSMVLAGGMSSVLLYLIAVKCAVRTWQKWLMGGAVITAIEFVAGVIVNKLMCWNVWNYEGRLGNLCGQICVSFSLLWAALCVPGVWMMRLVGRRVFREAGRRDAVLKRRVL